MAVKFNNDTINYYTFLLKIYNTLIDRQFDHLMVDDHTRNLFHFAQ